jgi:hypothetical protein
MLREDHRLKVLRKILGPKREKLRRLKRICTLCPMEDAHNWSIHEDDD